MKTRLLAKLVFTPLLLAAVLPLTAQVPQIINYQGKIAVGSTPFTGTGQFRFALVNGDASTSYWSNDGSSTAGSQPTAAVSLPVVNGLYIAPLGDATLTNMTAIPATVFANADVRVRVWFNDGSTGSQLLSPDQRITSVGYAMNAAQAQTVPDGAITTAKLAPGITVPGSMVWQNVTSTSQQTEPGRGYVANNAAEVTLTLPASPVVGDIVRVSGAGAGGWRLAQNAGQRVAGSGLVTGVGVNWSARGPTLSLWSSIASSADVSRLAIWSSNLGCYVSADSGVSWTNKINPNGQTGGVAVSGDGRFCLVAIIGNPLWVSRDGGSFNASGSSLNWRAGACSYDGVKMVAVATGSNVFTSTNSGASWTARDSSRAWSAVASSADGSKLVATVSGGQIYTSSDSGVTWTPRDSSRAWSAVASSADGSRLVAAVNGGQIYTSSDSGVTWTPRDSDRAWSGVASSADGVRLVATVNGGLIYVSANSGSSWIPQFNTAPWAGVGCSSDGTKLVAVAGGGGQVWGSNAFSSGTTTIGTAGFLSGGMQSAVELQFIGGGTWIPLSSFGTLTGF